jgi:hypothetical protein
MPPPGGANGLLDVLGVLGILIAGGLVYGFTMSRVYRRVHHERWVRPQRPPEFRKAA